MTPEAFIRSNTALARPALVGEFELWLASEITPIWQASEGFLRERNMAPPYWAFAWPGGQVLARVMLDGVVAAHGRRVLDFAAGCGVAALGAARRGAACVEAVEIDALAVAAIGMNAAANGETVWAVLGDVVGQECRWDLIVCGDVCYDAAMTRHIMPWLRAMAAAGAEVLIADPGRAYVPSEGMEHVALYMVPTSRELEDQETRATVVRRVT